MSADSWVTYQSLVCFPTEGLSIDPGCQPLSCYPARVQSLGAGDVRAGAVHGNYRQG